MVISSLDISSSEFTGWVIRKVNIYLSYILTAMFIKGKNRFVLCAVKMSMDECRIGLYVDSISMRININCK